MYASLFECGVVSVSVFLRRMTVLGPQTSVLPPAQLLVEGIFDIFGPSESVALALVDLVSPIFALFSAAVFELLDELVRLTFRDDFIVASLEEQDGGLDVGCVEDGRAVVVEVWTQGGRSAD